MKPASIAQTLGWSERRVLGRLAKLRQADEDTESTVLLDSPEVVEGPAEELDLEPETVVEVAPPPTGPIAALRKAEPVVVRRQRAPVRSAPRDRVERITPLTESKLGFCRRFDRAGWKVEDIAWLFDVSESDLARALGRAQ